jgi:tRNA threonylcarbamoyladenosine biosynthesis protein TsaB
MSYLLIKTADMNAYIEVVDSSGKLLARDEWDAGRQLAKDILAHIDALLGAAHCEWGDIEGIGVFKGPGSFTSLRIGLTVANTISYAQQIPIVGLEGDGWREEGHSRLVAGDDDKQVMPHYGADPHITAPRK